MEEGAGGGACASPGAGGCSPGAPPATLAGALERALEENRLLKRAVPILAARLNAQAAALAAAEGAAGALAAARAAAREAAEALRAERAARYQAEAHLRIALNEAGAAGAGARWK
jgi:hypothetical protein